MKQQPVLVTPDYFGRVARLGPRRFLRQMARFGGTVPPGLACKVVKTKHAAILKECTVKH